MYLKAGAFDMSPAETVPGIPFGIPILKIFRFRA